MTLIMHFISYRFVFPDAQAPVRRPGSQTSLPALWNRCFHPTFRAPQHCWIPRRRLFLISLYLQILFATGFQNSYFI